MALIGDRPRGLSATKSLLSLARATRAVGETLRGVVAPSRSAPASGQAIPWGRVGRLMRPAVSCYQEQVILNGSPVACLTNAPARTADPRRRGEARRWLHQGFLPMTMPPSVV